MHISRPSRSQFGKQLFYEKVSRQVMQMAWFLKDVERILDFGAGTCMFTRALRAQGKDTTPIDVRSYSYYPSIKPLLYDGKHIPFQDSAFDCSVAIAVLHHTPDPDALFVELVRVSRNKLIILEDLVTGNPLQRWYTFALDSVLNREFIGHPHSNKTDNQWRTLFASHNLDLMRAEYYRAYGFLQNGIYYLQKRS